MPLSSFSQELMNKCSEADITSDDAARIEKEIAGHVQLDTPASYYISVGPMPGFAETKLDVFLLTESFIYNYELTVEFEERWFTFPLTSVSYIAESQSTPDNEFWSVLIGIKSMPVERGLAVVQGKLEDRDRMRKFANDCRKNISAIVGRIS